MFNRLITRFREGTDPERRRRVMKICGMVMAVFTVFTLVAVVSYLFTWKTDQSLLSDPQMMDASVKVSNAAGKIGYQWSHLLVARWFGLGAFALVLVLAILSMRMLLGTRPFSVIKAVLLSLTAAFLSSFILAYVSILTGAETLFGGGLGGDCGSYMIKWSQNLVGTILTFFVLAVFVALWFLVASRRFSEWFIGLGGEKTDAPAPESVPAEEAKPKRGFTFVEKLVDEVHAIADEEPVSIPEPEPEIAPEPAPQPAPPSPVAKAEAHADDGLEVVAGDELSTDIAEELPRIDVRSELESYRFPPLELLDDYENGRHEVPQEELKRNNYKIRATLKTYKIDVDNVKAVVGPTVTLYKVYPAPGVKISAIRNLQDDIAMALKAKGVRVVTLEDSVGIEVANDHPSIVPLKAMLNDASFRDSKAELPVAIGYTITQKVKVFDLADAPHLLVAGATKQGKSVGLNVLISSLLYSKHPSELKFVFIDPKMVEFSAYSKLLKHYLAVLPNAASEDDEMQNAIAKTPKQAENYLRSLCVEMDERYELLSKALVNKITLYNEKYKSRHLRPDQGHRYMPYIVVVVDEYADLTMSVGGGAESKTIARSIMTSIIRLAQKGRAAGIHVVLATQRPSVDVVNGLIKSNFPTRIAFRVFSSVDSKTILDAPGADKLIGKGDMIYLSGVDNERIQCAFISNDEINAINEFIGNQQGYKKSFNTPYYLPAPEPESGEEGVAMIDMKALDERFEEAARLVVTSQRGSTSDLQRKLGMGYAKAGRVMDQLEAAGIVGPQEGSKPRQVLVTTFEELDRIINAFKNQ
ncbi:MAG: DNA translocase FtsK 4TM domain-containing protein [Bacteroidales bacterium]|nr:DNA translocase FtsK 4TM domain-containing protein [Bacteroidales bacterium]